MNKLYRAISLDDIAKHFRNRAKECENQMNRATTASRRNHLAGQMVAMNEVAYMLENMKLIE